MLSYLTRYIDIQLSRRLQRPPRTLPILLLWITDRCNLRCRMCGDQWRVSNQLQREPLSLSDIRLIIEAAQRLQTMIISFTGGEPLLRQDIFDILALTGKAGIAANICTNGTLLSPERVAGLADSPLRSISISIDSPDPETHDRVRGLQGSFDLTLQGIERLRKAMPNLQMNINTTVSKLNFQTMAEMIKLTAELGCDKLSFNPIHTNLQHKHKPKEEFEGLIFRPEEIDTLEKRLKEIPKIARALDLRTSSTTFLGGIARSYRDPLRWHTCYAGYASCAISPWGNVSPCVDMGSTLNVRDMPLDEIWFNTHFQKMRLKTEQCTSSCWDTTNTEIAIRFTPSGVLQEFTSLLRDLFTYTGRSR